jgi:hypothetical protein
MDGTARRTVIVLSERAGGDGWHGIFETSVVHLCDLLAVLLLTGIAVELCPSASATLFGKSTFGINDKE